MRLKSLFLALIFVLTSPVLFTSSTLAQSETSGWFEQVRRIEQQLATDRSIRHEADDWVAGLQDIKAKATTALAEVDKQVLSLTSQLQSIKPEALKEGEVKPEEQGAEKKETTPAADENRVLLDSQLGKLEGQAQQAKERSNP